MRRCTGPLAPRPGARGDEAAEAAQGSSAFSDRLQAASLLAAAQHDGRGESMEMRPAYLGLFAGLRVSEIVAVGPDEWQGDVISVQVKGGWIHKVPVHPELSRRRESILSDWTSRRQTMQGAAKRLGNVVGQPTMSPHWLRRTFAERPSPIVRSVVEDLQTLHRHQPFGTISSSSGRTRSMRSALSTTSMRSGRSSDNPPRVDDARWLQ
jgi:hypothetical protein